jgi:WS/DGAT/MGAT family acyltransferase
MGHSERLRAVDASFLASESAGSHMQVGAVLVFEGGPLLRPDGGVDAARIRAAVAGELHRLPHFRQRLARVPLEGHPVWIDDASFDLDYHVRHVSLARPGDVRALKRMAGWLLSQPLDRRRPLWELWVVEGLEGGRFAVITKAHHCMLDGLAAVGVLLLLLRGDTAVATHEPQPWRPRRAPGPAELLAGALVARARAPLAALADAVRAAASPRRALADAWGGTLATAEALAYGLRLAPVTPLNPPHVGPHRRFDWLCFEMAQVDAVRRPAGATVNDVALCVASGGLERFLHGRGARRLPATLRTLVPVSLRGAAEGPEAGNRVALVIAELPLRRTDALRRLRQVTEETRRIKASRRARGTEIIEEMSERLVPGLIGDMLRLATRSRTFNLIVTNVPGPRRPLYLLGARLLEAYPVVPLFENQALGIALFSYAGSLYWGLNVDRDAFPDLHDLTHCLAAEFEELCKASAEGARSEP